MVLPSVSSILAGDPAFAAWPAIVFLVSLQSIARSILPRSSTTTSASFAASYFTGAQHGVARYLGNFAERGCSLCQQPVPHRQRIRRSPRRSCPRAAFSSSPDFCSVLAHSLSHVALVSFNTDHAFARICILVYPYSPPPLFLSCCGYPSFFSALPSASRPRRFARAACFIPLSVIAFVWPNRTSCVHVSTSHRGAPS